MEWNFCTGRALFAVSGFALAKMFEHAAVAPTFRLGSVPLFSRLTSNPSSLFNHLTTLSKIRSADRSLDAKIPSDWCGLGCTLLSHRALAHANFTGYDGRGT